MLGRAEAFYSGDYIYIRTMSLGMLAYSEPDAEPHYLASDATAEDLGNPFSTPSREVCRSL